MRRHGSISTPAIRAKPATPRRGGRPSIRRETSRSKRRPAPARRACWSIATSACCWPASSRATSWRSRSRARPRRRCGSESCRSWRGGIASRRIPPELWREIRESLADIAISTIDAFCLVLLREFPLEADVDPGFELADETETPRLVDEALDRTLRARPRPGRPTNRRWRCSSPSSASFGCARASRGCSTAASSRGTRCRDSCATPSTPTIDECGQPPARTAACGALQRARRCSAASSRPARRIRTSLLTARDLQRAARRSAAVGRR